MKLISLSYHNRKTGWNIDNLVFNNLTLLVGASGVGKTQILRALRDLVMVVKGESLNGVEWKLAFQQDGLSYRWEGAFTIIEDEHYELIREDVLHVPVEYERLYRINGKEVLLVDRTQESLQFNNQTTVKLENEKSAIALLKEENDISPIYQGFLQVYTLTPQNEGISISPIMATENSVIKDVDIIRKMSNRSMMEKLFLLYKHSLKEFVDIKERFINIFSFVEDVKFTVGTLFNNVTYPILLIKEKGVEQWISQEYISSGMYSTLSHLVAMTLAKDGDVMMIDEFENSLGVNCIEDVADMVLNPDADVQFVITSHHPYVINNIDYSRWKIVTRSGGNVKVHTAEDLHIGTHSKHDAFLQLIQSKAYKTGNL